MKRFLLVAILFFVGSPLVFAGSIRPENDNHRHKSKVKLYIISPMYKPYKEYRHKRYHYRKYGVQKYGNKPYRNKHYRNNSLRYNRDFQVYSTF